MIYQSSLVEQETCGPCCDGSFICGASSVCRPTASREQAFCVPSNVTKADYCGANVLLDQTVACESCDGPSPDAELFQSQFRFTRRRLNWWAPSPSQWHPGPCTQNWNCQVRCRPDVASFAQKSTSSLQTLARYFMQWYQHCVQGVCKRNANACSSNLHCSVSQLQKIALMLPFLAFCSHVWSECDSAFFMQGNKHCVNHVCQSW